MSQILNVPEVQLDGVQMIEASAGTGKTWTVAALYLRLLLERALPVEKILVVTYTNAATDELRSRIRARLLEAQQACNASDEPDVPVVMDPVLKDIFTKVDRGRAQVLLTLAIESFDLAAIHTIHGFCQRALAERAFESGAAFDAELASDDRRVLHEAVEDFWRREIAATADSHWLAWLLGRIKGPGDLLALLSPHFGKPYLLHVGPALTDTGAGVRFDTTVRRVREVWQGDGAGAVEQLLAHGGLHKTYYKPEALYPLAQRLDAWFALDAPTLPLPQHAERLTPAFICDKTSAKREPPGHTVCDAMHDLHEAAAMLELALESHLGLFLQRALQACEAAVHAARQRQGTRSFDDLLLDLYQALHGDGGAELADSLRQRYRAALIDEFQDTDPLQYGIFSRVFVPEAVAGAGAEPIFPLSPDPSPAKGEGGTTLFFVGDPKQAIYSFRGADLRAYLEARKQAGQPLLLDTNRRSTAALIAAVNTLFGRRERPFLDADLAFEPVHPPPEPTGPLLVDGVAQPALELWFLPRNENEASAKSAGKNKGRFDVIAKNRANPAIAEAVAGAVAGLLAAARAGRASCDGQPLAGQDIAVLVKSHYQGRQVRDALRVHGVASVHYGQDSIYMSADAVEVERVLLAIANPAREGLVRAALATDLMGVGGDELAVLDGQAWLDRLESFSRWHALARDEGFVRMWRCWQREADVAPRLLALPDGERRMTNLLHLADLLGMLAHDGGLGVDALAKHLADARHDERGEADSGEGRLLRLESDENLVRIVTIHTSKGLEYPVTFCPFLWDAALRETPLPLRYHDPDQAHRAALDFGSTEVDTHRELAAHEARAEALRLAYVALTRAKQQCVLVWGALKDAEASPLAWLLHGEEKVDFGARSDAELRADLAALHQACTDVVVRDLPPGDTAVLEEAEAAPALAARPWPQRSLAPWRMHSFSTWAFDAGGLEAVDEVAELPDHDGLAEAVLEEPAIADETVNDFPRGAAAGTCLHAMFEEADFRAPEADVIHEALLAHGYGEELQDTATRLLAASLHTPMTSVLPPLREIPRAQQVREMEFMLPVRAPDMEALAAAVGPGAGADGRLAERIRQLQPARLAGFLKGFIDLVFVHGDRYYVLDYKSNHLGAQMRDYAQPALSAAMAGAMYDLQALLYGVAVHRALRQRLPDYDYDRHCGGALYLFLRGMRPEIAGSGVYAWRPDRAMMERVDSCLTAVRKVFA